MLQSYATDAVIGTKKQQFWTDAVSEVLFPIDSAARTH